MNPRRINSLVNYKSIEETKSYWYAWNVVERNIVACKDCINACARFLKDIEAAENPDYPFYFDLEVASRLENGASCLNFTSGARAKEPVELAPPQAFVFDNLYAWRFKDNPKKRRFRTSMIMKARKNAKSFDMALISIFSMNDEEEAEVVSVASKKDQAKISFKQCRRLIASNPRLAKKFKLNRNEIRLIKNESTFIPLASEEKTLDGISPSVGIIDEAFVVPEGVRSSIASGTGARLSPLIVSISTSYDVKMIGNWAYDEMEYTKKVNSGELDNERHWGVIYQLDSEEEYSNPAMWEKANPLIPYSPILMEDLQESFKKSIGNLALTRDFKIKRMNLILSASSLDKYISLPAWERKTYPAIDTRGKYAFYGLDLSINTDLCAVSKVTYCEETDTYEVKAHAFLPRARIEELEARDDMKYRLYADEGYIDLIDGEVIDNDYIYEWIKRDSELSKTPIAMICYDPYNSDEIMEWCKLDGIPTVQIFQGMRMLSGVTKTFRAFVYKGKIINHFNPILTWCVSNAITTKDKFNNEILDKLKSVQKIDLLAATIFAFLGCYKNKEQFYGRDYSNNII